MTLSSPHSSHFQIGIGLAQNLCLLIDQSLAPSNHLPKRPLFKYSGFQLISLAFSNNSFLIFFISTKYDEVA